MHGVAPRMCFSGRVRLTSGAEAGGRSSGLLLASVFPRVHHIGTPQGVLDSPEAVPLVSTGLVGAFHCPLRLHFPIDQAVKGGFAIVARFIFHQVAEH